MNVETDDNRPLTEVAVGIISRPGGEVLLAQRPAGKPYAGWWEFPGGKFEPGETGAQAIARELEEELGVAIHGSTPWLVREHTYEHARVRLHFRRITGYSGEPESREGQAFGWYDPANASVSPLLPATTPLMRLLSLPEVYAVSAAHLMGVSVFLEQLASGLSDGLRMLQLREPSLPADQFESLFHSALALCRQYDARLLVNSQHPQSFWEIADGVHLRGSDLAAGFNREVAHDWMTERHWVGASCHGVEQLNAAASAGVDFAVLGPVKATASHPGQAGIGWSGFQRFAAVTQLPVFAIGGMAPSDLAPALEAGAHGIAMIRGVFQGREPI